MESRIAAAAARAHRSRSDIQLIAVTKKFPAAVIREAFELGLRDFGENYVQEFEDKRARAGRFWTRRALTTSSATCNPTKPRKPRKFST